LEVDKKYIVNPKKISLESALVEQYRISKFKDPEEKVKQVRVLTTNIKV
jgi:hypothetical protein